MEQNTHNTAAQFWGNTRIQRSVVFVLVILGVFLAAQTGLTLKEYGAVGTETPPQSTVTVTGSGEVFAVPDTAEFTFSVVEERETVEAAQEIATEKGNRAIAFLKENGVTEENIKTTDYRVSPRYEFHRGVCPQGQYCPPGGNRVLAGFEVRQTISVEVDDTEKAGTLLSGLGEIGVSDISGLQFTIENEEELRRQARQQAIEDAKTKARALAEDLDVSFARIVNFHENGNRPFPEFGVMGRGGDAAAASAPQLPAGENKITVNVTIVYELR